MVLLLRGRTGLMLVELGVVEQPYHAAMEALRGALVTEVDTRCRVWRVGGSVAAAGLAM